MPTDTDRRLVRASYWVAAIVDFVVAVVVLVPGRMGVDGYVYPMGLMAAVAFSWGMLLLVADRKPMERRWVLAPTALVVVMIGIAGIYTASRGLIPVERVVASSVVVVLVAGLLAYSWYRTRPTREA